MAARKAKWQNDYIAKTYDRINLTVPKGRKEEIKQEATSRGMSVNGFLNSLIDDALPCRDQTAEDAEVKQQKQD